MSWTSRKKRQSKYAIVSLTSTLPFQDGMTAKDVLSTPSAEYRLRLAGLDTCPTCTQAIDRLSLRRSAKRSTHPFSRSPPILCCCPFCDWPTGWIVVDAE